jgi:hypothetical protein
VVRNSKDQKIEQEEGERGGEKGNKETCKHFVSIQGVL